MKKLIALTLMVACLACCSLGCKKETKPAKPAGSDAAATQPAGGETKPAGGETKPAE